MSWGYIQINVIKFVLFYFSWKTQLKRLTLKNNYADTNVLCGLFV